jgi:molybdopterin/thiamine biosynthesis adenylyltransferase
MDIVTNALDNVQARQYVDLRCVENKVALVGKWYIEY